MEDMFIMHKLSNKRKSSVSGLYSNRVGHVDLEDLVATTSLQVAVEQAAAPHCPKCGVRAL